MRSGIAATIQVWSRNYRCERGWKESPADRVLVAVGRRPNMSKVLADDCQVQLENGRPLIRNLPQRRKMSMRSATVARKRLAQRRRPMRLIWSKNLAGRGHRMQLSVGPNGMYVVLPVVPTCICLRSRRLRRLDLKMTPAFII